jgi:hypothetical protein
MELSNTAGKGTGSGKNPQIHPENINDFREFGPKQPIAVRCTSEKHKGLATTGKPAAQVTL